MSNIHDEHYSFIAEWYDAPASLVRNYNLCYYPVDSSIEMYDIKNHRTFLKRSKFSNIRSKDFYLGAIISVYGRQLSLTQFGDKHTEQRSGLVSQRTFGLIYAKKVDNLGSILSMIETADLQIVNMKMVNISQKEWNNFALNSKNGYSGIAVGIEILGMNAVDQWLNIMTQVDSIPNCDGLYGSEDSDVAMSKSELFFSPNTFKMTAQLSNCTCAVVKPHAVKNGNLGSIVEYIQKNNFKISAVKMFYMNKANSSEFFEIYKGVVSEYSEMVQELSDGPCVALEVQCPDTVDVVNYFRSFCGPYDPEIALHLRPDTLRAKFGNTVVRNAVHCSDLQEDGVLEAEYFFRILAK